MHPHLDLKKIAKYAAGLAGLNWGLVGVGYFMNTEEVFVNLNVINLIFSNEAFPWMEAAVYILLGLLSLYSIIHVYKNNA